MNNTESQRNYLKRRRLKCISFLGGKCVECSSLKRLEFDHKDPSTKSFEISQVIAKHLRWELLLIELKKCQLLCWSCHVKKSSRESLAKITHGKYHAAYHLKCDCRLCINYKESLKVKNLKQSRIIIHGTRAGYLKEIRRGKETCSMCRKANTIYTKSFQKQALLVQQ